MVVSLGFISEDRYHKFHSQQLMVSFPPMDQALINLCCSAQQYKGTAAFVTLDTASQTAIKRKHRMLSSLEPEHTEFISSTSLCYVAKGP